MTALTGPADLRDQRWLDERIAAITDGIDAVLDIAANWTTGRNLARLHPGVSAKDYILGHVPHPLGPGVVVPLLKESNWSNRQIAAVAGVSRNDVNELALTVPVDRPTETLGADGKLRAVRPRVEAEDPILAKRASAPPPDYIADMPPDLAAEEVEFRRRARWSRLTHQGTETLLSVHPEDFIALLDATERDDTERLLPLIESWIERTRKALTDTGSLRVIGGSR